MREEAPGKLLALSGPSRSDGCHESLRRGVLARGAEPEAETGAAEDSRCGEPPLPTGAEI